jgi:hypothetical protein
MKEALVPTCSWSFNEWFPKHSFPELSQRNLSAAASRVKRASGRLSSTLVFQFNRDLAKVFVGTFRVCRFGAQTL